MLFIELSLQGDYQRVGRLSMYRDDTYVAMEDVRRNIRDEKRHILYVFLEIRGMAHNNK